MSKNVDLSSKEWCDLIFEGLNKDFGAYQMRQTSVARHNKAVIFTLIGLVVVAILGFSWFQVNKYLEEQKRLADQANQEIVAVEATTEEKKDDEPKRQEIEKPKEEPKPEPKIAQQAVTQLAIKPDAEVTKPPKSQEELNKDKTEIGQIDQEGLDRSRLQTAPVAQVETKVQITTPATKEPEKEVVFKSVEQMPSFPGGDAALYRFINSKIQYPPMAQENNIQGRVIVQFVVTKTGSVGEVKVVRSVDRDLDREAIRVVKLLPKFTPGRQNGQPVSVWYTLPVMFQLQGTN